MTGKTKRTPSAYAAAGVNIAVMTNALRRVKTMVRGTFSPSVLGDMGDFGGLFQAPGRDSALVSSIDGVGTKLKVAALANRHDTVGEDLVNHCVNDILVQGARPLFFLDYIGAARLDPRIFQAVLRGLCRGCRRNGCALIGGETAEMPGLYPEGEYDLVGATIGVATKRKIIRGARIRPGATLIGLRSSGLHTNGYSLARRILLEQAGLSVGDRLPGTNSTVGRALLAVHRSYLKPVMTLLEEVPVQGMAHITGGGLTDNLPRILPPGCEARIHRSAWTPPPLFQALNTLGGVDRDEMYQVFNMGIGYVIVVARNQQARALELLRQANERPVVIGTIAPGARPRVRYLD
ncbi:MAG: phosphoribosylformylglycinamidine cyclo-ligase [Candidatus Marinimicrobia bacterium]|nr:phosphoribosylformylglycinamidine cyclo-ligase [Candidatus Neomarinimicrobiota bacterium]